MTGLAASARPREGRLAHGLRAFDRSHTMQEVWIAAEAVGVLTKHSLQMTLLLEVFLPLPRVEGALN